jgi:alpha-beta hydrolase superfamily lysophospholipase
MNPEFDAPPASQTLGLHRREFGWFDHTNADQTSFVTVREPLGASDGCIAIVVSPLGIESQGSSASIDALESALVRSGHVTIRFDPPGTGSSPQTGDNGPTWDHIVQTSVRLAEAAAQRWPGRPLVFVGVQLGAPAAVDAANLLAKSAHPVTSLVAWAPTVNGKKYLRALKMFGAVATEESDGRTTTDRPKAALQVAGYRFGAELQESIGRIQLSTLPILSVDSVLVVDRDDVPSAGPWTTELEKIPSLRVKSVQLPGTKNARFDDPELGVIPTQVITEIVDWVDAVERPDQVLRAVLQAASDSSSVQHDGAFVLSGSIEFEVAGKRIRETVSLVDSPATEVFSGASLLVVTTEPCSAKPHVGSAVVITSTGANSSSGPGRLNARLARRLGATGHVVVRYDRRGVGGSSGTFLSVMDDDPDATRAHVSFLAYAKEHLHDLRFVVQNLGAYVSGSSGQGARTELDLIGTCSGATLAYRFALSGMSALRIRNLVTINQILWDNNSVDVTRESPLVDAKVAGKLLRAAKNPLSWPGLLRSDLDVRTNLVRVARHIGVTVSKAIVRDDTPGLPSNFQRLRTSGMTLTHVFDSEEVGVHYLRENAGALLESLRRRGELETWITDGAGHTFGPASAQRWLVERVTALLLPVPRS